jgi:1-acyl-sn-glycerol-3-phosphate acyltransferase
MWIPALILFLSIGVTFLIWLPFWLLGFLLGITPQKDLVYPVKYFFKALFLLTGTNVRVTGNKPSSSWGNIFLSNHQSSLDIGILIGWNSYTSFLSKSSLFKIPLFGWAMKLAKCLPVYRGQRDKNMNIGIKLQKNLELGYNYSIFPEGTRSSDGSLLPFKRGIFNILFDNNLPCLPITIVNANRVLRKNAIFYKPNQLDLYIHEQIHPQDFTDVNSFLDKVRSTIEKPLEWK